MNASGRLELNFYFEHFKNLSPMDLFCISGTRIETDLIFRYSPVMKVDFEDTTDHYISDDK